MKHAVELMIIALMGFISCRAQQNQESMKHCNIHNSLIFSLYGMHK